MFWFWIIVAFLVGCIVSSEAESGRYEKLIEEEHQQKELENFQDEPVERRLMREEFEARDESK